MKDGLNYSTIHVCMIHVYSKILCDCDHYNPNEYMTINGQTMTLYFINEYILHLTFQNKFTLLYQNQHIHVLDIFKCVSLSLSLFSINKYYHYLQTLINQIIH